MISVIIPVYNGEESLRCCIDSVLLQTYKNIEVIVINDGSTDKTADICQEYIRIFKEENILYKIINQDNKGAPNARNHGFQGSKGDYIIFCDADAVLEKDCFYEMFQVLENHPEASYAYSSFYWGKKLFKLWPFDGKKLRQMPYIHSTSLIRTKDFPITGWDENIKRLQDWDLWLTMLDEEHRGIFIDKILFRVCASGTMSNWLPSIAYKLAPFLPEVKKYHQALKIVKEKHGMTLADEEKIMKQR